MPEFLGYAKSPEPKWPYVMLIIIVLAVLLGLPPIVTSIRDSLASRPKEDPKQEKIVETKLYEPTKEASAPISAIGGSFIFSTGMAAGNKPIDEINEISKGQHDKLYVFTNVDGDNLRHVFVSPAGEDSADIKTSSWSYVGLYNKVPGKWEVRVVNGAGNILSRKSITILP
ncbi:DUF2914 domain-containing protein [Candidatus Saganbacteria bacterium]|nr:DUF2914 domain-containing protein [Candidatus Saganbacteria bacterium]